MSDFLKLQKFFCGEIEKVENLCEEVGYGRLMFYCSALWYRKAVKQHENTDIVFVPTCLPFIKEEERKIAKNELERYLKLIEEVKKNE